MPVTVQATAAASPNVALTCSSTAVITIVKVTTMPYAAASAVDEPKPMTIAIVLSIGAQFTYGT
jgi:hypothetical protein